MMEVCRIVVLIGLLLAQCSAQSDLWTCNFGTSEPGTLCNLQQEIGDQFDWSLRDGSTPSQGTGPASGFGGAGYYIFIETSDPKLPNDAARIHTPDLNFNGNVCVRFAYNMFGPHIGSLQVYRTTSNNPDNRIEEWRQVGEQGQDWIVAAVDVAQISANTRIGFEGVRGNDYQGDIAIDEIRIVTGRCDGSGAANLPLSCDFETASICGFTQSRDDSNNYDWTQINGPTPTSNSGPRAAHQGTGYIYLETSDPRTNGEYAIVSTPPLNYNGPACVTFYYNMNGDGINNLRVYKNNQRNTPVFERTGDMGESWFLANVDFQINSGDRISFDATRGTNIRGDIAIDTLSITGANCQGSQTPAPLTTTTTPAPSTGQTDLPYSCSFEVDLCQMFQRTNDQFDWTRKSGSTDSTGTGPNGAAVGQWYIYTEASSPRVAGDQAYIETPSIRQSGTICVEFRYHMNGGNMGQLIAFTSNRGSGSPFFTRAQASGNEWIQARMATDISFGERVVFLGEIGNGVQGDISLDDINIRSGSCTGVPPPVTPAPPPTGGGEGEGQQQDPAYPYYACNMESQGSSGDNCRIRQDTSDSMDFLWGRDRTPSGAFTRKIDNIMYPVTGPSSAQQGAYYIYVEASTASMSDMARLIFEGADFRRTGNNCLRFWYNMNGFHINTLTVFTRMDNGQNLQLWRMKGDKGPNWFRAAVDINMIGVQQVTMEATVRGHFNGDLALDDVTMTSGRCENIPSGYVFQCKFESSNSDASLCGMQQDTADTSGFEWQLHQGPTESELTGPASAFSAPYYIYIEASKPRNSGDRARIFLPRLERAGSMCVEFYYHMYGFHTGQLALVLRRAGTTENRQQWSLDGEQGNNWRQERVTLTNVNFDDQIGFVGVRGNEYSGDIALDDVRVRIGNC